ncbi:soluble calcium-activated nucleotidase 1 [Thecamonas trahens ATCC 50062]|uniref:Soluble calcium-activated nucleotidase 1 n=1 Tax=Thecamonas trahens ATCC 50062 TaxID=461836 RepID=A0A0L0D915_THETB|nr:soluble calcium-activated nucleotidase 1 [Thecamonas trahens ATCC 50062]KNC48720.1 soluble calcium-activated nucleotidase 1 [Thecamonas trahens ATCC 50062]|eukprot:XP_013762772.1 soluble calcium-activated nucleotidase 1 [Thecamonas trahens ATCC 50062]
MLNPRNDSWFSSARYAGQRKVAAGVALALVMLYVLAGGSGEGMDGGSGGVGRSGKQDGRSGSGYGAVDDDGVLVAGETRIKPSGKYDDTYPLGHGGGRGADGSASFVFAVVADMDQASKVEGKANAWSSILKIGRLTRSMSGKYDVTWVTQSRIESSLAVGGRSMELSALVAYNGGLWTCDDRTGVVYQLEAVLAGAEYTYTAVPKYILAEGDGETSKNLKCEWMSVKNGHLFVGGFGKEFVNDKDGSITSEGPMWVKLIDAEGRIEHVDWRDNYRLLRKATGTEHPGYLLHEAVMWHEPHGRWYFLPRRVSPDAYDEVKDERRGSNLVLSVPPTFKLGDVSSVHIGEIVPSHGFSAVRFVPGFPDEAVALKSVEDAGIAETYIMVFNVKTGKVLMPETKFGDVKFEGIEFLQD